MVLEELKKKTGVNNLVILRKKSQIPNYKNQKNQFRHMFHKCIYWELGFLDFGAYLEIDFWILGF